MSSLWYVMQTHRITEVTEKGANSFDQELLAVLGRPVSSSYATTIAPPLSPWSPTLTGSHFEASLTERKQMLRLRISLPKEANVSTSFAQWSAPIVDCQWSDVGRVTIDMLPEIALLDIFDFYEHEIDAWHTLVHVCRKWRIIVFGSPRRLDLRLLCTASTPVRELLDIWPQLPIVVSVNGHGRLESWFVGCTDNVIAALEHNDRICELDLNSMPRTKMAELIPAMQQSFPALTRVKLHLRTRKRLCIPDLFFDNGSAPPPLQTLILDKFPFPGLPILLPSAIQLVHLEIRNMFCREYISPEQMVTYFSVMTGLERLEIEFESLSSQRSQHPPAPPKTRTLLPALTKLRVFEVGGYLEDLVARIDAPLLDKLIIVSHELISDTH